MVIYGKAFIDTYKKESLMDDHQREMGFEFHSCPLEEFCQKMRTDPVNGLTRKEASARLNIYGPNEIALPSHSSKVKKYFRKLFYGYHAVLWLAVAGDLALLIDELTTFGREIYYMMIIRIIVEALIILTTSYFLCIQEDKDTFIGDTERLRKPFTTVRRDGMQLNIPTSNVVIGDLVELKFGDCVPADMRIIECSNLETEHAVLNGDPTTVEATNFATAGKPMYSRNLMYAGCNIVGGSGLGIVLAAGNQSVIGRLSALANNLEREPSPLSRELNRTATLIKVGSFIIAISVLIVAVGVEIDLTECLMGFVLVILSIVPEGLFLTITISLMVIARRTASKNCLIRNLTAVATLGATSIIVTDTTGAITRRRMVGSHIWIDNQIIDVDLVLDYGIDLNITKPGFAALSRAATLCNGAEFKAGQEGVPIIKKEVRGDPIEAAILQCMEACVGDVMNTRKRNPKVIEVLDDGAGYQLSIHRIKRTSNEPPFILVVKGSPEVIVQLCSSIILNGENLPFSQEMIHAVQDAATEFSGYGEHVIAFADFVLPADEYPSNFKFDLYNLNFPTSGYRFVGLISLLDPPKPGVSEAIQKCRTGGIKIIMVTRDDAIYAKCYAKSIGIISEDSETPEDMALRLGVPLEYINPFECSAAVLDGTEIASMSTVQFNEIIRNTKELVFANTTALQKFAIVHSCQQVGGVVAVTGHHFSDIPSLKLADVGVGMFIASLEITKQYADVLLLDDSFASIVTGIEEGRLVFENLRKLLTYILASNVPELMAVIVSVFLGTPLPICGIGILLIDFCTDLLPGISLAYEPDEGDVMKEPPRNPSTDTLLSRQLFNVSCCQLGMFEAFAAMFSFYLFMLMYGYHPFILVRVLMLWSCTNVNDYSDTYGQEWTILQREELTYDAHTTYFSSIVFCQMVNLIICKTRRKSIFFHGMRNHVLNAALVVSFILGVLICQIEIAPFFELSAMPFMFWLCPIPFALAMFCYDEARRFTLRHHPGGFIEEETYY